MKKTRIIFVLFFVIVISIVIFYYKLGIGFGKATVKTVKTIEEVKTDFKDKNISPIDSIIRQTDKVLDSLEFNNKKDSLMIK